MKVAIGSDIHGSLSCAHAFFTQADALGAEKILLLGDLYYHGVRNPLPEGYAPLKVAELINARKDKILAVRGNCDSDVDLMVSSFDLVSSAVLCLGGKTVFASHGDRFDIDHLPAGKYDLVLYGHYHTGFIRKKDGVIVANPGSLSLPKDGTEKSFLILDDNGLTLYSLEGKVLDKIAL